MIEQRVWYMSYKEFEDLVDRMRPDCQDVDYDAGGTIYLQYADIHKFDEPAINVIREAYPEIPEKVELMYTDWSYVGMDSKHKIMILEV